MKTFINSTLIEAGKLLNSQVYKKEFVEYKKINRGKDYNQIVTEQDLLVESFIIKKIQKKFPNTNIISEEQSLNDFSLEKPTWVIDPIDGSMNYFRGLGFYCLSLSFWEHNEPQYGSVYSPYSNELFQGAKGQGATLNGKKIKVSGIGNLYESIILVSGYESFRHQKKEKKFLKLVSSIKNMRVMGSSILEMCYIAAGRCEGRVYSNCKFWDLSAAKLILEEAGGQVTDWKGNSKNIFSPQIVASNKLIHKALIRLL